ncbi:family 10 glycosylhydrolase [Massilia sp. R2A-15]|uniref:glycoside hydrolase family 10 protein n=1 Tax=Massilia sp. R2A-15 TaxID=3064278 RepID=UPI0027337548|nr:family 10 glycosylhydrolase [Massilia sp. R2A-15]WLI91870.1 family 10 glycosylhydrolase [Massilia sp. R2A-15]
MAALLASCTTIKKPSAPVVSAPTELPPASPHEFRAAWVSTVANIDWPTKQNLNAAQQQAEAIAILDRAKALNMNAVVLQVRPSADAIYPSKLEPWTEYLTGAQGTPPQPMYDPLAFWVAQAHARGLQLHAWFNPYRARHPGAKSPLAANHIAKTNPAAVKTYGKHLWMDPAEDSASKQTLDVVLDVVRRYDIDGVHIDDYFYPYPIEAPNAEGGAAALDGNGAAKAELDFPDQPAWQRYLASGGKLDRASWRRQNVNHLIEALYTGIHKEKNWVLFGISPFGLGKPDRRPAGIMGFSQYDKLYADAELWLESGWLDYLSPQLYWAIDQKPQAYDVLLDYWIAQNRKGRHIWPGLFTSRIGAPSKDYPPAEIIDQIKVTHARPGATGHVHFSMAALMENRKGISDQLKAAHYASPALVPATPWLAGAKPGAPVVTAKREAGAVSLKLAPGKGDAQYAIWSRYGSEWRFTVAPASQAEVRLAGEPAAVFVNAVDRLGNESAPVAVLGK